MPTDPCARTMPTDPGTRTMPTDLCTRATALFHNRYDYRIFTIDNRLGFRHSLCIANDCGKRL